ncbi:MAG: hypothetical protein ABIJ33_03535 [Patescibacteria group bacterium]
MNYNTENRESEPQSPHNNIERAVDVVSLVTILSALIVIINRLPAKEANDLLLLFFPVFVVLLSTATIAINHTTIPKTHLKGDKIANYETAILDEVEADGESVAVVNTDKAEGRGETDVGAELSRYREQLLYYLYTGEPYVYYSAETATSRLPQHVRQQVRQQVINVNTVRLMALRAGYPELAVFLGRGQKFWVLDTKRPATLMVRAPNRVTGYYAGEVEALKFTREAIGRLSPDLAGENDPLQHSLLEQLNTIFGLVWDLQRKNMLTQPFMENFDWDTTWDGQIAVWIVPQDCNTYNPGWYTATDLKLWLESDTNAKVLKAKRIDPDQKDWSDEACQARYRDQLERLWDPQDDTKLRLLRLALMRCHFPNLVNEFQARLQWRLFIDESKTLWRANDPAEVSA